MRSLSLLQALHFIQRPLCHAEIIHDFAHVLCIVDNDKAAEHILKPAFKLLDSACKDLINLYDLQPIIFIYPEAQWPYRDIWFIMSYHFYRFVYYHIYKSFQKYANICLYYIALYEGISREKVSSAHLNP